MHSENWQSQPITITGDSAQTIPSGLWRQLAYTRRPTLTKGLDAVWHRSRGAIRRLMPKQRHLLKCARAITARESHFADLTDAALNEAIADLQATFRLGRQKTADTDRAFAVIREAARREVGMLPYPEQIAAALAIDAGCITEVATGEGKTLIATLPAIVAGWRGRGCHVITVNDYLAKRDAQLMQPLYKRCGVRVAWIEQDTRPEERRQAYNADVTYLTNKEAAADLLRDRLAMGQKRDLASVLIQRLTGERSAAGQMVMRGLACAIVDEADSVLIDEAVTPLIIASENENEALANACKQAARLAEHLTPGRHYRVDHRYREITLTRAGKEQLEQDTQSLGGLWNGSRRREELVNQALSARELFLRDKHYVVRDDQVVIVDESTGRLMPDRSWRDAMHQAVEIKEGLEITPLKETMARISFQRFFRLYDRLGGMTGTAAEASGELWQIYDLPFVAIPTHRPCIRQQWPDRLYTTAAAKWTAIVDHVKEIHATGRPILIGTRSVEASEHLSKLLDEASMPHHVLNAVRHEQEAELVAKAGERGSIMVATNMAGRGTDIKLATGVAELGGLHVIATERHESGRIDRQLFGRAGRQGDPGSAIVFASLEDELVRRYRRPHDRLGRLTPRLFARLQQRAQAISRNQRKGVLKSDDWSEENLGFTGEADG